MRLTAGDNAITTKPEAPTEALAAFIAAKAEIDTMLARLTALSDDNFETHPDKIQWGNVGDLSHYVGLLRQITDSAFSEGEFAE
jgi:hypothetical protein